jgi:zinc protease
VTRQPRRIVFVLAAAAVAACGTSGQPPPAHVFPVQELTLPSGLRVVIEQDEVSPIAGVTLIVDVGSSDDPTGKHGTAHTIEHMAFRAPDETGRSMYARLVNLGAASINGATGIEQTSYHAFCPRWALPQLLAIVAHRLADPLRGMDDSLFAKESAVVAEEIGRLEGAYGLETLMPVLLPAGNPYARAYAERRQTPPLSLAEVRGFADRYYRSERITLVISGAGATDWKDALLPKLPAAWRGDAAVPRSAVRRPLAAFAPPAAAGTNLVTKMTPVVTVPELWMAWRVPPAVGTAASRLSVTARVVDRMLSGRLDADGTNDVLTIDAFAVTDRLASAIVCRFKLRSPNDAIRIRNETRAAIEALGDPTLIHIKGRLRGSYDNALTEAKLRTALGMESLKDRTEARAELAHSGSGALLSQVLDDLEKITIDDVASFAQRYLQPDAARAVLLVPEEIPNVTHARARLKRNPSDGDDAADTEPDPVDAEPEGEPATDRANKPAPLPSRPDLLAVAQAPGTSAARVRTLSNGLTAVAMRRAGLPFVSMLLGFHADPQPNDPPGARIAYERTLDWRLSSGPLERGILLSFRLYADSARESLSMFSNSLETAFDLMSEEGDSLHVVWPNPAFQRWADHEAAQAATPSDQAARAFVNELFGTHAYHLRPTAEMARKVTGPDAQAWLRRVRRPANGALIIVGDVDPEMALQAAERTLHGWTGDATPPPPPPQPPAGPMANRDGGAQILYTNDPRRRTAFVRFGCFLPPVRTPRDSIVNDLLSSLIEGNFRRRLRLQKGVTYDYDVAARAYRGGTAVLFGQLDVAGKASADAIKVLRDWFDEAPGSPITEKRVDQYRWSKARRSGMRYATGQQLAGALFRAWNMGWQPAALDDYPRDLASVTTDDVSAALKICRKSAVISVLGPETY